MLILQLNLTICFYSFRYHNIHGNNCFFIYIKHYCLKNSTKMNSVNETNINKWLSKLNVNPRCPPITIPKPTVLG